MGQAFGGWQFSAVVKFAKGTPFTVTTTALDLNFDGFSESRPVLLDPSILGNSVNHPGDVTRCVTAYCFSTADQR